MVPVYRPNSADRNDFPRNNHQASPEQETLVSRLLTKVENLENALNDLQSRITGPPGETPPRLEHRTPQQELMYFVETILQTMKKAQDNDQELQTLRKENQSLKERLEACTADSPAASPAFQPTPQSSSALSKTLGKRKRKANGDRPSPLQFEMSFSEDTDNSEIVLPETPAPDTRPADLGLENSGDIISRKRTQAPTAVTGSGGREGPLTTKRLEVPSDGGTQDHQHRQAFNQAHLRNENAAIDDSMTSTEDSNGLQESNIHTEQSDRVKMSTDERTNLPSQESGRAGHSRKSKRPTPRRGHRRPADDAESTAAATQRNRPNRTAAPENVEFSDEEPDCQEQMQGQREGHETASVIEQTIGSELAVQEGLRESTEMSDIPDIPGAAVFDIKEELSPVRTRASRRRTTDGGSDQQARSMAPEPQKRRRTMLLRSKTIDLEDAFVATPDTIAEVIANHGKPKPPKPKIQTTEKILNKELKALGLEKWIGKDKQCREYRQEVSAARLKAREAKKAAALSGQKIGIIYPLVQDENDTPTPNRAASSDEASGEVLGGLADYVSQNQDSAQAAETVQQWNEMVRERDRMAEEAMQREEALQMRSW